MFNLANGPSSTWFRPRAIFQAVRCEGAICLCPRTWELLFFVAQPSCEGGSLARSQLEKTGAVNKGHFRP
jgi:hypothetical protein